MKITSIPQLYRNVRRWQEIFFVMRRYGLADWLSQLRVDFIRDWIKDDHGVPLSSYSRATRVRMAFTELGPTFIKLGQVLSLRPELIGAELATELTRLQSDVPADPPDRVRATIEKNLGNRSMNCLRALMMLLSHPPRLGKFTAPAYMMEPKSSSKSNMPVSKPKCTKTWRSWLG